MPEEKKRRQNQSQPLTEEIKQIADDVAEAATTGELAEDEQSPIAQVEALTQEPNKRRILPAIRKQDKDMSGNNAIMDILLFGVTLMAITAVVAGLLAFIHAQTEPIISLHDNEKKQTALQAIFPSADKFVDALDHTTDSFAYSDSNVSAVYLVYKNNELIGYCANVSSTGYSSTPIEMIVGSDLLNKVTDIHVISHSETPGIGETLISQNENFFKQFAGQSRPIEFSNQITAVSGATFTSDGIKNGVNTALDAVDEVRLNMAQLGEEE